MSEVSIERARTIAIGTFLEFANEQAPLASEWTLFNLPEGSRAADLFGGESIQIDDINGIPLFYDFFSDIQGDKQIAVRTYANTAFGTPVDSIWQELRGSSYFSRFTGLHKRLRSIFGEKVHPNIVCYCYPKLGVMVYGDEGTPAMIYDLYDEMKHIVPSSEAGFLGTDDELSVYSFYQRLPEGANFLQDQENEYAKKEESYAALVDAATRDDFSFLSEAEAGIEEKILDVPLYGQETSVYCAVATAQMILKYHGFTMTQNDIATAMNTSPTGSTNPNQVEAYKTCSNQKLDAIYDPSADFSEARSQIDQNLPLKSGIPGHARAVIGCRENTTDKWLHVNDPYPLNQGKKRIESSANPVWTNWIYVKRPSL